ncbi:MAG TPA: FAD-dependent oxidoreductase [Solirubrobacteraceae bacterium]|jgi:sulfide:quinone oxidoreductase|nr:FAD-dependent oxidoreductase [Solirubrobacteraceae bacterium]
MSQPLSTSRADVVIAGGGVAALEALIALHELAPGRVRAMLVAPEPDFVYRPLSVTEPFCLGHATRYPLAEVARDFDAELVRGALAEVDAPGHTVTLGDGSTLNYESLLVAVGARSHSVFAHAITFGAEGAPEALSGLLADLEEGYARRVAFVVPSSATWSLPLYELAIITARHVWGAGIDDAQFTFVTPEAAPLELFGPEGSRVVAGLLANEGIEFVGSASPDVVHNGVEVHVDGRRIDVDRTVTLPVPEGPRIAGLPVNAEGFVGVDEHGAVQGLEGVYAAGDATAFPIKQGGLAAQQAVAAAEAIAARHGADLDPQPYRPILRGMLLTGGQNRWMRGPAGGTPASTQASDHALWWPPTKIATRYLAPYLLGLDDAAYLRSPVPHAHPIERDLELLASQQRGR